MEERTQLYKLCGKIMMTHRQFSSFMDAVNEVRKNSDLQYAVVWCSNGGREDQVVGIYKTLEEAEHEYDEQLRGKKKNLASSIEELKYVTSQYDEANRDFFYLAIQKITVGEDEYDFDYEDVKSSEMYYYEGGIIY